MYTAMTWLTGQFKIILSLRHRHQAVWLLEIKIYYKRTFYFKTDINTAISNNKRVHPRFLDLAKVFDTVDREILLSKLKILESGIVSRGLDGGGDVGIYPVSRKFLAFLQMIEVNKLQLVNKIALFKLFKQIY